MSSLQFGCLTGAGPRFIYQKLATSETWTLERLRESIRVAGPVLPAIIWQGELIEGRRRWQVCAANGRRCRTLRPKTLPEAAALLWAVHPARALAMFGSSKHTLTESAKLFGTTPGQVAVVRRGDRKTEPLTRRARVKHVRRIHAARSYLKKVEQGLEVLTVAKVLHALKVS